MCYFKTRIEFHQTSKLLANEGKLRIKGVPTAKKVASKHHMITLRS